MSSRNQSNAETVDEAIRRSALEIAQMVQRAREEEGNKAKVLIEKAQWEAELLRQEGMKVKETLSAEIEQLRQEVATLRASQRSSEDAAPKSR